MNLFLLLLLWLITDICYDWLDTNQCLLPHQGDNNICQKYLYRHRKNIYIYRPFTYILIGLFWNVDTRSLQKPLTYQISQPKKTRVFSKSFFKIRVVSLETEETLSWNQFNGSELSLIALKVLPTRVNIYFVNNSLEFSLLLFKVRHLFVLVFSSSRTF